MLGSLRKPATGWRGERAGSAHALGENVRPRDPNKTRCPVSASLGRWLFLTMEGVAIAGIFWVGLRKIKKRNSFKLD